MGRKSPLGGHGWISSPKRLETANSGHFHIAGERLFLLESVTQRPFATGGHRPIADIHVMRGTGA